MARLALLPEKQHYLARLAFDVEASTIWQGWPLLERLQLHGWLALRWRSSTTWQGWPLLERLQLHDWLALRWRSINTRQSWSWTLRAPVTRITWPFYCRGYNFCVMLALQLEIFVSGNARMLRSNLYLITRPVCGRDKEDGASF